MKIWLFGLKLRKKSKKEIDEKVQAAAKILNLESLLERKPRSCFQEDNANVLPWEEQL